MTERFASLKYNPKKATRSLDIEFPELFRHPEWKKLKELRDWQKIASYILFLYSKDTDLIHEHPSDLKARKDAAAIEAGFEKSSINKWSDELQDIMDIKNPVVTTAIMQWLKIQKHSIWTEIVITSEELFDFQKLRIKPIDQGTDDADKDIYDAAKKKDALMEACNQRIKVLESLMNQFYGDSRAELQEFNESITPENAERLMMTNVSSN